MKIEKCGNAKIIMQNPDSIHNYFAWPSAAKLQDGRIAIVASGYRLAHVCPFGKMVISFSDDEGETYTPPAPLIDTPVDNRDGGICTFGECGVVASSLSLELEFVEETLASTLEHKTNLKEYASAYIDSIPLETRNRHKMHTFRISNDCGRSFGPIHTIPVSSPHGPYECGDGKLLWVGRKKASDGDPDAIFAYKVDTATAEYEKLGYIPKTEEMKDFMFCEPYAIVLDDGRYLCHFRVQKTDGTLFTTYQSTSSDGGYTWSVPRAILSTRGGAPAHIMKHSSGVLISTYGNRTFPYGIRAMFSYDNGESWDIDNDVYVHDVIPTEEEKEKALRDSALICGVHGDIGYPTTVELSDGSLLSIFYAHPAKDAPALIMQQKWRFQK